MSISHLVALCKKAATAWDQDDAASMGAAIAFYTLFSFAPLLLMVIAIAGMIFGQDVAQGHIIAQIRGLVGDSGAQAADDLLKGASNPASSIIAAVASSIALLIGATSVFAELYGDLNKIWRAPSLPKASGILQLVRTRILSFGMILGIGFLLLVSLVISAGLAAAGEWWGRRFAGWEVMVQGINFVVGLGMITVAFAMIYKFLPRARIAWKDVWIGAAVTALLFSLGKLLIGLYIGTTSVASGFGTAGSLVVLLIWVYYSAQIFLLGAEFTWVYAYRHGSRAGEAPPEPAPRRRGPPLTAAEAGAGHHRRTRPVRKKAAAHA